MDKLKNTVFAMKITDIRKYPANYEELSTDAALRAERLACQLRNIIFATDILPKPEYMDRAAKLSALGTGRAFRRGWYKSPSSLHRSGRMFRSLN